MSSFPQWVLSSPSVHLQEEDVAAAVAGATSSCPPWTSSRSSRSSRSSTLLFCPLFLLRSPPSSRPGRRWCEPEAAGDSLKTRNTRGVDATLRRRGNCLIFRGAHTVGKAGRASRQSCGGEHAPNGSALAPRSAYATGGKMTDGM